MKNRTAEKERAALAKKGKPIPAGLWPPDVEPELAEFFSAFWELCTDRQSGPIPASSVDRWADRRGLSEADADLFRHCIRAMDAEVLTPEETPMTPDAFKGMFQR